MWIVKILLELPSSQLVFLPWRMGLESLPSLWCLSSSRLLMREVQLIVLVQTFKTHLWVCGAPESSKQNHYLWDWVSTLLPAGVTPSLCFPRPLNRMVLLGNFRAIVAPVLDGDTSHWVSRSWVQATGVPTPVQLFAWLWGILFLPGLWLPLSLCASIPLGFRSGQWLLNSELGRNFPCSWPVTCGVADPFLSSWVAPASPV